MSHPENYSTRRYADGITVEFTVAGVPCLGLNGGPAFKHKEAFSLQIAPDDQSCAVGTVFAAWCRS